MSNLTIEGGVRWEGRNLGDRFGNSVINLKKNFAPRIGFTFDPTNDGKGKIFAHYGRYYEDIPTDINIRAFGGELQAQAYNFSPDPANLTPISGTPTQERAARRQHRAGRSEPQGPVHRRVPDRRRARSRAEPVGGHQVQPPQARPT